MNTIRSFFLNLNLSHLSMPSFGFSTPVLFAGLILIVLILFGLSLGRTRTILSLLSIYISFALIGLFPYYQQVTRTISGFSKGFQPEAYVIKIALLLISYIVIFLILGRAIPKKRMTISESSIFAVVLVSILQLGLLISIIMNILPDSTANKLNFSKYFSTAEALFLWSLAPVVVLMFLKRKKSDSR